jgi:hypothetical protein
VKTGRWFSPGAQISSTNKTDYDDTTEILLNVALNTINQTIRLIENVNEIFSMWLIHIKKQNFVNNHPLSPMLKTKPCDDGHLGFLIHIKMSTL